MENVDKAIAFFWRALCLYKKFRVGWPKIDFLKNTKGGPFGSAGGRIPEEKKRPSLNLPLNRILCILIYKK